ncbi:MAG: outer membrane protein assembly factor BamD [Alphaproteobacteria bacterium]|jgi:outer membrane protein assembly factor BamD|nr:outer membrane protein assembly factor BamD [Alphaproteobacteria bacterium]
MAKTLLQTLTFLPRATIRPALLLIAVLALAACSTTDEDAYVERPVENIYNGAMDLMFDGNYQLAAREFDEVERQHPYSTWANRAQVMAAYSYYQANAYDEAIIAAERFVELHPGHDDVAYAYYLIAISYYEQISDIGRDQKMTSLALTSLDEVVRRFPSSTYARDARLKTDLARDHLAGKEMAVGRYYLTRDYYIAAVNRFRIVIERYQTTSHVPEALHRLVESYLSLGVYSEAQTAAAVLGYNYPGSDWYADSYALLADEDLRPAHDEKSWIDQAFDSVF